MPIAERIKPKALRGDFVLAADQSAVFDRFVKDLIHNRATERGVPARHASGTGLTALFTGAGGTGKTVAAEFIAKELGVDLYRIDLSAAVSKYIGETEKNLERVFETARDGSAVLFFDEADALFGKRTEVKDAHDRYANLEIGYLLQQLEAHNCIAILATNRKSNIETAFTRRIRHVVNFSKPKKSLNQLPGTERL